MTLLLAKILPVVILLGLGIGGGIFLSNSPQTKSLFKQSVEQQSTPIPIPSPTQTPTPTPSPKPTAKSAANIVKPAQVNPSDRALKLVAYFYLYTDAETQKKIVSEYSGGSGNPTDAIRNFAIYLDKDTSKLAILEAAVEQDKIQKTKVNSTSPIVLPQQTFPQHCTSNTIGDYTYTNCY